MLIHARGATDSTDEQSESQSESQSDTGSAGTSSTVQDEASAISLSSLNLIYHLLQNAENGQQKLTIGMLREFVESCDYDEEDEGEEEGSENEDEDESENSESGDTNMSGDDNSSHQEDDGSDEREEGTLSLNELEFLLAVVKAGKREIYPITKIEFLEILDAMN
jgi:hypothetical protein